MWRFLLPILFLSFSSSQTPDDTPMLIMLDAMQKMMTGEEEFDRDFYNKLDACMEEIDPRLRQAQDGFWQGIIDYWNMNGTGGDFWGGSGSSYIEENPQVTEVNGMIIYEPCNYASNVAYYHDFTEMCERYFLGGVLQRYSIPENLLRSIATGFQYMAVGSSFMHGTRTSLGGHQDVRTLAIQVYQLHQASLDSLERNPILHDLNLDYRQYTALEMTEGLTQMYLTANVTEWRTITDSLGIPDYYLSYAGLVTSIFDIVFPEQILDTLIPIASRLFGVDPEIEMFLEEVYLPTFRNVTADLDLNIIEVNRFRLNAVSTFIKILYAFLWQEDVLTENSFFLDPDVNARGWELLPEVNAFANRFSTFPYHNEDFQNGTDVYPGDYLCNPVIPHAKWHLESGIGLLDLAYLGDSLHNLLSGLEKY